MPDLPRAVTDAADITAITQLILRERAGRDLGLWDQMRDCFHPDSRVRLSWIDATGPEFVRRSKEMAERGVRASHRLGPILVTLAGERAIAQLAGIIDIPFTVNGVEVLVSGHSRFLFRTERRDGAWRISFFDPIYQRDELSPVIPGQVVKIDPEAVKSFRAPYRLISYCLSLNGFPPGTELAGIDRPDLVESLTREVYAWAGLPVPR